MVLIRERKYSALVSTYHKNVLNQELIKIHETVRFTSSPQNTLNLLRAREWFYYLLYEYNLRHIWITVISVKSHMLSLCVFSSEGEETPREGQ